MKWMTLFGVLILVAPGRALAEPPASPQVGSDAAKAAPRAERAASSLVAHFGDWALVCGERKDNAKPVPCTLVQNLIDANSKKTAFSLSVGYGPRGNLVLIVRTPLGVALAKGLELSLEGLPIQRVAFTTCKRGGCQALVLISKDLQQEMHRAPKAVLTVYALSGKPFQAVSSLKGLGDGLGALNKRRGPS